MNDLKFLTKNLSLYVKNSAYNSIKLEKPQTCPHCATNTDALCVSVANANYNENHGGEVFSFIWRCTACRKAYSSLHYLKDKQMSFLGMIPRNISIFNDKELEKVSPRFIEMYNQALRAENNEDYNLAAIGFRSSLELLIKDFAIVCLGKDKQYVIKLSLFDAITEFLEDTQYIKVADVIRILGNDHTHYERKYPDYDFSLLKSYMEIFIGMARRKILINNPPVSREQ